MIYVTGAALFVAVGCLVCACGLVGVVKGTVREHARERQLFINQIMHLTGRTWTPPPAEQWASPDNADQALVTVTDQFPDDHDWDA